MANDYNGVIRPDGWTRPSGYAHGVLARGRLLAIAGQAGAPDGEPLVAGGLAPQFEQALVNVAAVVRAAGGSPENLVSVTVYVTDRAAYQKARPELGAAWRRQIGEHYPAMTLVEVKGLFAEGAVVELQGLAVLP